MSCGHRQAEAEAITTIVNLAVKSPLKSPLDTQIGGGHYKKLAIQPVEYIHANKIGFFEGSAITYLSRWKDKGGLEDLEKAKHFIDLLIQLETKESK